MTAVDRATFSAGDLTVHRIRRRDPQPKLAVVLCHGFGAPGSDLVPIAGELIGASPDIARHVAFYFPEAPISLGGFPPFEMRAWWMIDTLALEEAIAQGRTVDRSQECPEELPSLRASMDRILETVRAETNLGAGDLVLGGFSQGSMLATDVTLHLPESPAALTVFSGTLLCPDIWNKRADGKAPFRVLQSHGRQDPLLPFSAAERLFELLGRQPGARFIPFDGPHTIPPEALVAFLQLLEELLAER